MIFAFNYFQYITVTTALAFVIYNFFLKYWNLFYRSRGLSSKRLHQPTKETEGCIQKIIQNIGSSDADKGDILSEMILDLPPHEDILRLCVGYHYDFNLLQIAIQFGHTELVVHLVQTYGKTCNGHSPPLHLASFCGHDDIVRFFITYGESLEQLSNVNLPVPHNVWSCTRHTCSPSLDLSVTKEMGGKLTPVQCAILGDQSSCLKLLVIESRQSKESELAYASQWLHLACKYGAINCALTLLEMYPNIVNIPDNDGWTPLCNAVHCGEKLVQILLDHGATAKTAPHLNETILHRLYSYIVLTSGSFYKTTKCLLDSDLKEDINRINAKGCTPLNLLIEHMSYQRLAKNVHCLPPSNFILSWPGYQQEFNDCLTLLLEYGASPHLAGSDGIQPLNKILHIALEESIFQNLHDCCRVQPMVCICRNLRISRCQMGTSVVNPQFEPSHQIHFQSISKAINTLLKHGADPNTQCTHEHAPLKLWLICLGYLYPRKQCNESEHVLQILTDLLEHGADSNFATSSTYLSRAATQYFQFPMSVRIEHNCVFYADLVTRYLRVMLKYGFNPNYPSSARNSYLEGGRGNSLIDFMSLTKFSETSQDFEILHTWLKTLLQWGADPNVKPYASGTVVYHEQNSLFLQRLDVRSLSYLIMAKEYESFFKNGYAEKLLRLFYNTMDHKNLFCYFRHASSISQFHQLGEIGKEYLKLLKTLTMYPRTLKEIARVSIYNSLDRKVALKVPHLPLPPILQKYLLNI